MSRFDLHGCESRGVHPRLVLRVGTHRIHRVGLHDDRRLAALRRLEGGLIGARRLGGDEQTVGRRRRCPRAAVAQLEVGLWEGLLDMLQVEEGVEEVVRGETLLR